MKRDRVFHLSLNLGTVLQLKRFLRREDAVLVDGFHGDRHGLLVRILSASPKADSLPNRKRDLDPHQDRNRLPDSLARRKSPLPHRRDGLLIEAVSRIE